MSGRRSVLPPEAGGQDVKLLAVFGDGAAGDADAFGREGGFEPVKGVCIEGELIAVPVRAASGEVAGCLFAVGDNAEGHVGALEFAAGLLGSVCAE